MFACTPADDWMRSPGTVNAGQSWSYNIPGAARRRDPLEARALDKFIRKDRLFVGARQRLLQPAQPGDLLRPRPDHPSGEENAMNQLPSTSIPTGDPNRRGALSPSRARSIREFCDASLDYNPLHLDDDYMKAASARPPSAASSCTA
jgi:hypothetical protein